MCVSMGMYRDEKLVSHIFLHLSSSYFFNYVFLYVRMMCLCIGTHVPRSHILRLEDNFVELGFSFHTVCILGIDLRGLGLCDKCLYPVNHLASPFTLVFETVSFSKPRTRDW